MKECVCYIANDDTTFKDEEECLEYEQGLMLKKYERDIHMWDDGFRPISITDPQALDKVFYLTCDTAEAVEIVDQWFDYMGYDSPFSDDDKCAGRRYYYQDCDAWYDADDFIEKAHEMAKIFGV